MIPSFLWFRARPEPPRSGVLDEATVALVPRDLDGDPMPQDPVQRLVSIEVCGFPPAALESLAFVVIAVVDAKIEKFHRLGR